MISSSCYLLHSGFFLGLFFNPEDGGDMFLLNIGCFSTDYMALYPVELFINTAVTTSNHI
jgi:hypothetical protein